MKEQEFFETYGRKLNDNQLTAVKNVEGPVLLLAVPGSGKTTVLVTRLGYMLLCKNINPSNILTLTYTVAATKDMKKRFETFFGTDLGSGLEFRTINGICAKIIKRCENMLGKKAFELETDERVLSKVVTDILVGVMDEYPNESDVKKARTLMTYCKNMCLSSNDITKLGKEEDIDLLPVYEKYNRYLKDNRKMDYDDQMIYAYSILKSYPDILAYYKNVYRYICVDEAQDTSKIQHMIINLLSGDSRNLFMVGDEDQSIYGFRAAYPEALLNFDKDHPNAKVLVMDQNYRSNSKIINVADKFIQHNKARHEKHIIPTRDEGNDVKYIDLKTRLGQYPYLATVAKDCDRETAILYRDNDSILPLVDLLDRKNIPYRIKSIDMGFFTNRIVTDIISFINFSKDPYDTDLFMKLYYKCNTFLRKPDAELICAYSKKRHISVLDAVSKIPGLKKPVVDCCKSIQTYLKCINGQDPRKAISTIERSLGYDRYLERASLDGNKLFILKALAVQEDNTDSFLDRLEYLRELLNSPAKVPAGCNLILSTIHSSKGLEYDRVFIIDACDNILPPKAALENSPEARKLLEEERRLFYVGMTRAKNELMIFTYKDACSSFMRELKNPVLKRTEKVEVKAPAAKAKAVIHNAVPAEAKNLFDKKNGIVPKESEMVIGSKVVQAKYGPGNISDVNMDEGGNIKSFEVEFISGETKIFVYPTAFQMGMKLIND